MLLGVMILLVLPFSEIDIVADFPECFAFKVTVVADVFVFLFVTNPPVVTLAHVVAERLQVGVTVVVEPSLQVAVQV